MTIGAFVFAWVYSLAALGRIEDRVPQLPVALAILLSLLGIVLFLYLVQTAIRSMRPISILTDIANARRDLATAVLTRHKGDKAPLAVIEFVDRDVDARGQDSGPSQKEEVVEAAE